MSVYRQIIENANDAVIVTDRDGKIELWNQGAAVIFGYAAEEAMGQSLDLIIPERFRERHWVGYRKTMETGFTRYAADILTVPALRKDGKRISVEFTVTLLLTDGGETIGAAAIIRDVTARWQRDKELSARLRELEKKMKAVTPECVQDENPSGTNGKSPESPQGNAE